MEIYARALALVSILTTFFLVGCSNPGIETTLKNGTNSSIDNINIEITGAQYNIPLLGSNQEKMIYLVPTDESNILIKYPNQTVDTLNIYFEPGYAGSIEIIFTSDSTAEWSSDISLF